MFWPSRLCTESVYTFGKHAYHRRMESSTHAIVESLTRAIVEHRLQPGTKLAEQKLADHFWCARRCSSWRKTAW